MRFCRPATHIRLRSFLALILFAGLFLVPLQPTRGQDGGGEQVGDGCSTKRMASQIRGQAGLLESTLHHTKHVLRLHAVACEFIGLTLHGANERGVGSVRVDAGGVNVTTNEPFKKTLSN